MTPFGQRVRQLRQRKRVSQKEMARALRVSPAWLSALENGRRGRPSWRFVQQVIGYFNIIWDEAEDLEQLAWISHPRIVVNTAGLCAEATEFANLVADRIDRVAADDLKDLIARWKKLPDAANASDLQKRDSGSSPVSPGQSALSIE